MVRHKPHKFKNTFKNTLKNTGPEKFGIIPEKFHLISHLSVMENIMLACYAAGMVQDRVTALKLLEQLEIREKKDLLPAALTNLETLKVCLVRAIINDPEVLIVDVSIFKIAKDIKKIVSAFAKNNNLQLNQVKNIKELQGIVGNSNT